ncbi:transcriptional regulator, LacI family [Streptomyces sp. WMMB 714]|uniref:LacI family DNA-binding transcriptional regulator n=1 Tax=Streptomyces sp. WMMB 714 TaxID=1286822 RepID=UPI000823DAF2|nr:LacI family DNA-binding transcriptional regulator [Streptomyces sp. WMMB 714]SCK17351.1 transcriptional regulator, LacI family [Streptomyces sp. WMMB 714]
MSSLRVTQADVARHAGVSRTAASFVLSGREGVRIPVGTRQRIMDAAQELGYRPNRTAQSLRTRKTQTIALIFDAVGAGHYAGEMIQGALEAALERDHLLYIAETGGDPALEEKLLQEMIDRQVDGVILAAMSTRTARLSEQMRRIPAVLLNCLDESGESVCVVPDEEAAGRHAAQLLLDAGHRDGVHVVGGHHVSEGTPEGSFAGKLRMSGIETAMEAAGTRLAGTVECDWSAPEHGYLATRSLLESASVPAAVICCNDRLAVGAYQALRESELRVPDDISLVSFGDSGLPSWLRPPVTSVVLPHHELGRTAVSLLLADEPAPKIHRIPMTLSRRGSITPCAPDPLEPMPTATAASAYPPSH